MDFSHNEGTAAPAPIDIGLDAARPPGMWRQGWQRFRRNTTGMLGLGLVGFVVLVALACPLLAPFDPNDQSAMINFGSRAAPSLQHLLGTDRMGYDVLSRVV